jgi:hypothetical protein
MPAHTPARHAHEIRPGIVAWLLALDAGYRNAHMSDARRADMGLTRTQPDFAHQTVLLGSGSR